MNDQSEQIKRNFQSHWLRIVIMVLFVAFFALIWELLGILLMLLFFVQILFNLFAGESNRYLHQATQSLIDYLTEVIRFLSYISDKRPFPFSPWPGTEQGEASEPASSSASRNTGTAAQDAAATASGREDMTEQTARESGNTGTSRSGASGAVSPSATAATGTDPEDEEEDDVFAGISFTGGGGRGRHSPPGGGVDSD